MDKTIVIWLTIAVLLLAGYLLRVATLWLNARTRSGKLPKRDSTSVPQLGKHALTISGALIGALGVAGALWLPLPGLWGPAVLVFSVIWDVNADWKVRYAPWYAPVEAGLETGSRFVLLGGALGTLIAYVISIG